MRLSKITTMKKLLMIPTMVILSLYIFFNTNPLYAQWHSYSTGIQNSSLNDVKFINELTGFIVGEVNPSTNSALFLKTTDSGSSWVRYNIFDSLSYISRCYGIHFINENTGYIFGGSAFIYKTINGGINWTAYSIPIPATSVAIYDITFPSSDTGYAAGRYGYILKTTNAGILWDSIYVSTYSDMLSIHFFDNNNGIASDANSRIYLTSDGGLNWNYKQYFFEGLGFSLFNFRFLEDGVGYLLGRRFMHSILIKTTNNGNDWELVTSSPGEEYSGIYFFDENRGFITGVNKIRFTNDGGKNWQSIYPNNGSYNVGYTSITFTNDNTGYLTSGRLPDGSIVYKTTNGGTVSVANETNIIPEKFQISKVYPNPFNSTITLEINSSYSSKYNNYVVEIYDVSGRKRIIQKIDLNSLYNITVNVNFKGLETGVYFVRVINGDFKTKFEKVTFLK